MARELVEKPAIILEDITKKCLKKIGVTNLDDDKIRLLLRLIISGIGYHYFEFPDDLIDVGFLRFKKNPDKNELFNVNIIRSKKDGVINAQTLWRFYKGDLQREQVLRNSLESFLTNLINYSQQQEIEITQSISQLEERKEKKED